MSKDSANFTDVVTRAADSSILRTNPNKDRTVRMPSEAKALQRDRDRLYGNFTDNREQGALESIEQLSRDITDIVNKDKKNKWREYCKDLDYNKDARKAMVVIKSLSGKPRSEHSFSTLTDPIRPDRLLLTDHIKACAFGEHFSREPFAITKPEKKQLKTTMNNCLRAIKSSHGAAPPTISSSEVKSAISRSKIGRSPGVDGIPNELLKNLPDSALRDPTKIFNTVLPSSISRKNGKGPSLYLSQKKAMPRIN